MKKKVSIKKLLIAIILMVLIFLGINKLLSKTSLNFNEVVTSKVEKGDIVLKTEVEGEVKSDNEALIFSNLIGKVKKVNFKVGDTVKKGDVLAILDSSSLDEINSNIEKLKIDYNQKEKDYKNAYTLYQSGGISKNDLLRLENALKLSKIDLDNALKNKREFSNEIVSSVSGVIIESYVDENLKVDPSKYLFKIVDVENLKVYAEIPNASLKDIKEGNEVIITSDTLNEDVKIKSKIDSISKISKKSQKYNDIVTDIVIKLDKNSGLRTNEILKVEILFENLKDVIRVNFLDVTFEGDKAFVYVLDENKTVRKKEVELGKTDNEFYEVKKGLNVGEEVLNNSLKLYKEGDILK